MTDGSLRKFYGWFTVLGLLVGGLVVLGYYRDEEREWKDYQRKYFKRSFGAHLRRSSVRWPNEYRSKSAKSFSPT